MREEPPVLLEGVLSRLSGGDRAFELDALRLFLRTARDLLVTLQEAEGAGDREALARGAHTLKGNASSIGAIALSRTCADLEDEARRPDGLPGALVPEVEVHLDRLEEHLRALGRL